MKKISLLVFLLFSCTILAQEVTYKKELDLIYQSFKTKNYDLIKPLLTPMTTIGTALPAGMCDSVIPQILNQLPEPVSYTISEITEKNGGTHIRTEYVYKEAPNRIQSFFFNKDGKILDFDVIPEAKQN